MNKSTIHFIAVLLFFSCSIENEVPLIQQNFKITDGIWSHIKTRADNGGGTIITTLSDGSKTVKFLDNGNVICNYGFCEDRAKLSGTYSLENGKIYPNCGYDGWYEFLTFRTKADTLFIHYPFLEGSTEVYLRKDF